MSQILHNIDIPIYNGCLHVFFGSPEQSVQAIKDSEEIPEYIADAFRNSIDENGADGTYLFNETTGYHLIWMPEVPAKVSQYATLIHEMQHFVFKFLDLRGFSHTEASDEAYSYLLGFIFTEIDTIIAEIHEQEQGKEHQYEQEQR